MFIYMNFCRVMYGMNVEMICSNFLGISMRGVRRNLSQHICDPFKFILFHILDYGHRVLRYRIKFPTFVRTFSINCSKNELFWYSKKNYFISYKIKFFILKNTYLNWVFRNTIFKLTLLKISSINLIYMNPKFFFSKTKFINFNIHYNLKIIVWCKDNYKFS